MYTKVHKIRGLLLDQTSQGLLIGEKKLTNAQMPPQFLGLAQLP